MKTGVGVGVVWKRVYVYAGIVFIFRIFRIILVITINLMHNNCINLLAFKIIVNTLITNKHRIELYFKINVDIKLSLYIKGKILQRTYKVVDACIIYLDWSCTVVNILILQYLLFLLFFIFLRIVNKVVIKQIIKLHAIFISTILLDNIYILSKIL